jgi:hypothetical protein
LDKSFSIGHGALKKPWSITKMRDYFMTIKTAEPEMTEHAETIIKTYLNQNRSFYLFSFIYSDIIQCLVEKRKIPNDILLFVN